MEPKSQKQKESKVRKIMDDINKIEEEKETANTSKETLLKKYKRTRKDRPNGGGRNRARTE